MSTPYHAKLWAMELERRAEIGSSEMFARALSDAKVVIRDGLWGQP